MPMRLWLVFEDPVITRVKSEALASSRNMGKLDEIALSQDVLRLENFCSPSVEEMLCSLTGSAAGDNYSGVVRWFDSRDGLESIRRIIDYGNDHPNVLRGMKGDLQAFDKALREAVRRKISFRFQLDYRDVL